MARERLRGQDARQGFKQKYSTNNEYAASSAKGSRLNTATGRFQGATQGFTNKETGKLSHGGQMISRRKRYYQVRVGLGLSGG